MMRRNLPPLKEPEQDYIQFQGGLDLVTPALNVDPGSCREAQNYEIGINGGYERVEGYERFDGRAKPSAANYAVFTVDSGHTIVDGDTVTGDTSAATSTCIAVTATTVVVTEIAGDYESAGEDLSGSGGGSATATTDSIIDGASTALLHAQYKNLAADEYRADIAAVPGSGSILGVFVIDDVVYAWRNNAGATAAALYKSSGSGWTAVALGKELAFTSGGTTEITEGQTITGATSGETATLTRVMLESGTWAAGTAAGKFIFASQSGAFQAENIDVGAAPNLATIAGDSSAITMVVSGSFETFEHNFGGDAGTERTYGCDGVNRGWEFDGTVFSPIDTGMTTDKPTHVTAFKNHLFFSFAGSAQHSGIGTPYIWSVVFGAGELATGDTITGFLEEPGAEANASLGIYNRDRIHMLYGTSSSDWNLVRYRKEVGAYEFSIQQLGTTLMLDDRGITSLHTVQAHGNFQHSTISRLIQPWLIQRKKSITASCVARDKSQYRLFFSDKYALFVTVDDKESLGIMPILMDHKVECITSVEDADGDEVIYFGSDNGMVYQMEKGTSFDGGSIEHFLIWHFHHSKSPRRNKRYHGCALEVAGEGYASFNFTYELGYASTNIPQPGSEANTISFSSVYWDSFTWDAFYWDGRTLLPAEQDMGGRAENVSLIVRGGSDYDSPIGFTGGILSITPGRLLRS